MSLKAPGKLCSEIMPNGLHDAELWRFENVFVLFLQLKQTRKGSEGFHSYKSLIRVRASNPFNNLLAEDGFWLLNMVRGLRIRNFASGVCFGFPGGGFGGLGSGLPLPPSKSPPGPKPPPGPPKHTSNRRFRNRIPQTVFRNCIPPTAY